MQLDDALEANQGMPLLPPAARRAASESPRLETRQGSALIELFKSATLWTLPVSGGAAVYAAELDKYQWTRICLAGVIALQIAFMLSYGFSKPTRRLNYLWMQLLAYPIFAVCLQFVNAYPKTAVIMTFPTTVYFAGVANELRHSVQRTRQILEKPDFLDPPEPLSPDAPSPFCYPHTSHPWKFYAAQGGQMVFGAAVFGAGYGIKTPGVSQLLEFSGAMAGFDALFAALGKLAEDYMDRKNKQAREARQQGTFYVKIPLANKVLLAMTESIGGLQKLVSFVSPFFAFDDILSFVSLGIVSGAIRQHKQRTFERADIRGVPVENFRDKTAANYIARFAALIFATVVPIYSFRCLVKKNCTSLTLVEAEVSTAALFISYFLSTLVEYRWRSKIERTDPIPLEERGKALATTRLFIAEYPDIMAYSTIICLHLAEAGVGSAAFGKTMWIAGYGLLGASIGNDFARMNDIHISDWGTPNLSPIANIVFSRYLGQIILEAFSKK